jgi:hypothetical protein
MLENNDNVNSDLQAQVSQKEATIAERDAEIALLKQ